jgi:hypothetical protein
MDHQLTSNEAPRLVRRRKSTYFRFEAFSPDGSIC